MLTLEKRTATLRTLLTRTVNEQKLLAAAERVRAAKIQVLRAKIGEMPSPIRTPEQNRRIAKLDQQIEALRATMAVAILDEFRRAGKTTSGDP